MGKSSQDLRPTWVAYFFCLAAGCASQAPVSGNVAVDEYSDALTADQFACERTKRECLIAADCDPDEREVCESAFRSCEQPLKDARDSLHDKCHAEKETCEAAAADEAARQACHIAEHKCTLPVAPPEAVCRIEAEECVAAAKAAAGGSAGEPGRGKPKSAAEEACREKERACREEKHLSPEDLPKPPHCGPVDCVPAAPTAPAEPAADPADMSLDHMACERAKRECLIAADCAADKREVCESTFRACDEPVRAEKKRVSDACREEKETCEAAATDEAGKHACHIAEHRCKLPVEPAEAVCRIDAEACRWAAREKNGTASTPADPMTPPEPGMLPGAPKMPREQSAEEQACREIERTCVEAKRVKPDEDLPKPPHCPPAPRVCKPAPKK